MRDSENIYLKETKMLLDFFGALLYIGIIWSVGQWTIRKLFRNNMREENVLLVFTMGFSEITLISTFLYFVVRMPMLMIRIVWLALGFLVYGVAIKRHEISKSAVAILVGVIMLWLFLLIPGLTGKEQYYVYRGNCADQHTYVEETTAMSLHSISWYESRTKEEIETESDVLWRGYRWIVNDRPSAAVMIAVMYCNPSGEIYWVVYLYRMFVQAMIMPAMIYLFRMILETDKVFIGGAAILYCIGFWGQIQYDIDAVSQMSVIAVLIILTAVFLQYIRKMMEGAVCNRGEYYVMIMLAAASLALYLESALVHAALYFMTGILFLLRLRKRVAWKQIAQLAGIPVIAFGIFILVNPAIVHFLQAQIATSVSDERQTWANYFNAWWLGKHGIDDGRIMGPVSRVVNCIISTSGMYNMTVNYEKYYGVQAFFLTAVAMLFALLIIGCILRPFIKKTSESIWLLWIIMMAGIAIIIGMCIYGKYWSAGKLLYYISPYLYAYLCIPMLRIKNCRGMVEKLALGCAVLMLVSNVGMVLSRFKDVKVNWACIGYRGNYPSDMIPGLKMNAKFTFDTQQLKGFDGVVIQDVSMVQDSQIYLEYLKVKLTCAKIPWVAENDVDCYQIPIEASHYRTLTGNLAVLEAQMDEDGRYEIVIR